MSPRPLSLLGAALLAVALSPTASRAQCADFEVTPVPVGADWKRAWLEDVTALAPDDAWAVGFYDVPDGTPGSNTLSLAMHWDGSSWTQVPTQNPSPHPQGTAVSLHGVDAVAPDDVWAGGERYGDAGGLSVGAWIHVQHWDGSSWETVAVPEPPGGAGINFSGTRIYEVAAFASDDVWFGGAWAHPNQLATVTWRPLAMHWDGSSMTVFDTPVIFDPSTSFGFAIRSMSALGPDDIWAACTPNTAGQRTTQNVILHYDGSSWERVDVPDSAQLHRLNEIVALAADDVWVFGEASFPTAPFALHFDGSTWTEVSNPPLATSASPAGPDALYLGRTGVSLFDGNAEQLLDDFADVDGPSVLALDTREECAVWAVGRRLEGSKLVPFAARLEGGASPSPWSLMEGGITAANGEVPQLRGEGSLAESSTTTLRLTDAMPFTPGTLVVGASQLGAPFKGGTLVPAPDKLLHTVLSDAQGGWDLAVSWPAGVPAGLTLYFQVWMPDAAAPFGFAASDGLSATQP